MLIVFDKLLLDCIHDTNLHNRISEDKLRSLASVLLRSLAEYNDKTFQQIKKTRNCHFVNYWVKKKITDFFEEYAKKSEVKLFVLEANLYQIAIPDTEIRLIVNIFIVKKKIMMTYFRCYSLILNILYIKIFAKENHQN